MWKKNVVSDEEIYSQIARNMIEKFEKMLPECGEASNFIADEIFKAKFDSDNAVHCFFSPSKSNGWVECPAYLDRQKQWDGSHEPAIRGTITHHFLSRAIGFLKEKVYSRKFDYITSLVFQNPDWLTEDGVRSVIALLARVLELGIDHASSEVFIMSDVLGNPNKNLRFGGSIDVLHVVPKKDLNGTDYVDVHIYDLKTGKHIVSPDCWQLKCYALLVRDFYVDRGIASYCNFTLGIAQNGNVKEVEFINQQKQAEAFVRIKRAMVGYETYMKQNLNIAINDEVDSAFPELFKPCPYCRFCKGCYKRDVL
jgi:hypothetical protein